MWCNGVSSAHSGRFNLAFSWFALANLWLTFAIIIELVPSSTHIDIFGTDDVVSDPQDEATEYGVG
jgi:hypothetical protein